jgi:hypothetical protein
MKFFDNLPKTRFTSTIGNFLISDFFTYLNIEGNSIQEASINVDNKTTLIEASVSTYSDVNSFWAFVAANNTVNPFTLLADNAFGYIQTIENHISFVLFPSENAVTGGIAFPVGSLVFPYTSNTGPSFAYGYTGNYDLNGPYALVLSSSFYDGFMTIGAQYNSNQNFITTGLTRDHVTIVKKNDDGSYSWGGDWYTAYQKPATQKIKYITNKLNANVIYKEAQSSNITIDELLPESQPISGVTVGTTVQQDLDVTSTNIQAYIPSQLGLVQSSFITAKYI